MEKLLLIIAKALTGGADDNISVSKTDGENGIITYRLTVSPKDVGKIIGKGGKIIRAVRTVAKAGAVRTKEKINLEIDS